MTLNSELIGSGGSWEQAEGFEESELTQLKNKFVGSFYNFYRNSEFWVGIFLY